MAFLPIQAKRMMPVEILGTLITAWFESLILIIGGLVAVHVCDKGKRPDHTTRAGKSIRTLVRLSFIVPDKDNPLVECDACLNTWVI